MEHASSLIRALDVLGVVSAQPGGILLPELLIAVDMPRSTVVRILNTFQICGFVERKGRHYLTTEAFHRWLVRDRHRMLQQEYRPILEELARSTGELTLLALHEGRGIVHIDFIESDHAVRVAPAPATRHNLRVNAAGKLALSRRPDLCRRIRDARLLRELETIRQTGVAWNREESVPGMIALAVPCRNNFPTEPMLVIAWPAFRFEEKSAKRAVRLARRLCETR